MALHTNEYLNKLNLDPQVKKILTDSKKLLFPNSRTELIDLCFGNKALDSFEVEYQVKDRGLVLEANVTRCKNGIAVNYTEDYMRRRDPDSLVIGDQLDTDKPKFIDLYNTDFEPLRKDTFTWLSEQELIVLPFKAGGYQYGYDALLIAPANAAFFACGLADLQVFLSIEEISDDFTPRAIVYLAPPFRHTHFGGKQIVVHNRLENVHEVFSYNLYPGPSAKKGIYGVLLNIGEQEGWVTAHASTVKVITPYDNEIVIMHEGASGGGKSEMIEPAHRAADGRLILGENLVTGEKYYLDLLESSELRPVTDDMALCHPGMQNNSKKLVVQDAENGWFLRLDHVTEYGTSPQYEKIFTQPKEPLIFFNIQAVPKATCLVWEHTLDSDGTPCPNPRAILPRRLVPDIVAEPVEVDVRSFGVRTPPCTRENPSYGIMGMFHILPPALAWLWRLVAPRGYNNPSIVGGKGMISEGVGSYWPFATGKMVKQANLLLDQILHSSSTRYVLIPNQHIGVYKVSFNPQWVAREYIARRGSAKFKPEHLKEARCTLLGYGLDSLKVDGQYIRKAFLQPERQQEVGKDGYDAGAAILIDFFKKEASKFNTEELNPLGKQIIECLLRDAPLQDYIDLIPMRF
jgi:Archaeal flavoproteins